MSPWGELHYSLRRYYIDEFHKRGVGAMPSGRRVLDVGGYRERKRGRFDIDRHGLNVITVNISRDKRPDVQGDAHALPIRDGAFDAVLCSELLEHCADPDAVLAELSRVLRPGGDLFACSPFLYQIHGDPRDYARFTSMWWQRALAAAGLDVVLIEAQGRFWSVLADFLRAYATEGLSRPDLFARAGRVALSMILPGLRRRAVRLDARRGGPAEAFMARFTTGFGVIARKPAG